MLITRPCSSCDQTPLATEDRRSTRSRRRRTYASISMEASAGSGRASTVAVSPTPARAIDTARARTSPSIRTLMPVGAFTI